MFVSNPDAIDQTPLQFETGEIMELPLLVVLAFVSVLAVDRTDELGDKALLRGMAGAGRVTGLGAWRRPGRPFVVSCSVGLTA
jgi:hypothetical protein